MSSGVALDPKCVEEFNDFKLKGKYRYILYKMADDLKSVVVEKTAPPEKTYDDFLAELPADDCRYATVMYHYDQGGDGIREKVIFVVWAPETARIKSKMLYASTKDTIKRAFVGISIEIQGTDKSEVDSAVVLEKCKSVSK